MRVKRALALAAAVASLLLTAQPAAADDSTAQAQARRQLIEQVRMQLGNNLAQALAAQDELDQSLRENANQQADLRQRISAAEARLAELEDKISALDSEIATTRHRVEVERAQLKSLARSIYVQPSSVLVMLAQAPTLSDLMTRIADLNSAGQRARDVKARLYDDLGRLDADLAKQEVLREEQLRLRAELRASLAQLQELQRRQEKARQQLQDKIDETRYEMAVLAQQSSQLAQQIADMLQAEQEQIIAAAMQAVWDQYRLWQQSHPVAITASAGHSTRYRFIWPEPQATISQPYGPSTYWFEPPYGGYPHFHTGIDLVAPYGSNVLAADDGVVAMVGSGYTAYGNYVVLAHSGGLTTLYGHLSLATVRPGDTVTQGTVIGKEGSSGNSTGPHLHFELRINQQPVNPAPYLPPGPPSDYRG